MFTLFRISRISFKRDLFFFFSFSFNDYLPLCIILRHRQVYVAFLVGNKV